jgi:hypothetical protein
MAKAQKNRAYENPYISPNQITLVGFESPFAQCLDPNSGWMILAQKILFGLNRIKARLRQTSESWIATIISVLNLLKLIVQGAYCQILSVVTFSATCLVDISPRKSAQEIFGGNLELKTSLQN